MTGKEQIEIGQKIKGLIRRKIGTKFSDGRQGSGETEKLVIAASDKKFISKIKEFLSKELNLKFYVGSKNHGSGGKYTLLITLYEISDISKKIIEEKFSSMEDKKKKAALPIVATEQAEEVIPVSHSSLGPPVISKKKPVSGEKEPVSSGSSPMKTISPFLKGVFRFESRYRQLANPFSFDKEKTKGNFLTILCQNIRVAREAVMALSWFLDQSVEIIRDELELLISYEEISSGIKTKPYYCLPPRTGASILELEDRLSHVWRGSRPKVEAVSHNLFSVTYTKKGMVKVIYDELKEMGWSVRLDTMKEKSFLVECSSDWSESLSVLPSEAEKKEEKPIEEINHKTLPFTETERARLKELRDFIEDKDTFKILSEETKKDLLCLLNRLEEKEQREEEKKKKAEERARFLLSGFE